MLLSELAMFNVVLICHCFNHFTGFLNFIQVILEGIWPLTSLVKGLTLCNHRWNRIRFVLGSPCTSCRPVISYSRISWRLWVNMLQALSTVPTRLTPRLIGVLCSPWNVASLLESFGKRVDAYICILSQVILCRWNLILTCLNIPCTPHLFTFLSTVFLTGGDKIDRAISIFTITRCIKVTHSAEIVRPSLVLLDLHLHGYRVVIMRIQKDQLSILLYDQIVCQSVKIVIKLF